MPVKSSERPLTYARWRQIKAVLPRKGQTLSTFDILKNMENQAEVSNNAQMPQRREKKLAQVGVRMSLPMKIAIEKIAIAEDRTLSQVICRVLERWLEQEESEEVERDSS